MKKKPSKKFRPAKKVVGRSVPVVGTKTVVTNANESIQEFVYRKFKSTKFILIAESLNESGRPYHIISTDGKIYRSPTDYTGMLEGAKRIVQIDEVLKG